MKTEIEILGFEIEVKEEDGKVILQVEKGDEVIEEITLDPSEYEDSEGEDVKDFDSFEGEGEELPEEDMDDEEDMDGDDDEMGEDDMDDDEDESEATLESFDKFIKKSSKKKRK